MNDNDNTDVQMRKYILGQLFKAQFIKILVQIMFVEKFLQSPSNFLTSAREMLLRIFQNDL